MTKKIITIFLCLCLFLAVSIGVNADETQTVSETTENTQTPPAEKVPDMGEKPPVEEMPQGGGFPQKGEMPQGGGFSQKGEMPQGGGFPQKGEMPQRGEVPSQMPAGMSGNMNPGGNPPAQDGNTETDVTRTQTANPNNGGWGNWGEQGGRMPSFGQNQQTAEPESFFETYFDAIASVILLVLAFIFVIFYKRRQY